jgi:hypothetical protein
VLGGVISSTQEGVGYMQTLLHFIQYPWILVSTGVLEPIPYGQLDIALFNPQGNP